jgi:uncharacterized protein (TIGR02453 family)
MLEKSLSFLTNLKENNYKEWFHENKPLYEEAKKEFESLVGIIIQEVRSIDKSVNFIEPKDCIFRIFRDIRFTTDKTPYKTNFGAYMARGGGRKSEYGGYYFHLEPDNCLLAGGIWMPQPDVLKALRQEIYHNIDEFLEIISNKEYKKHFGEIDQDSMLKTAPKDYPKDWPHINLLKYKSYTVSKSLPQEIITGAGLIKEVNAVFKAMLPYNNFLNKVIEDLREG